MLEDAGLLEAAAGLADLLQAVSAQRVSVRERVIGFIASQL
jgi:hypothetical protein